MVQIQAPALANWIYRRHRTVPSWGASTSATRRSKTTSIGPSSTPGRDAAFSAPRACQSAYAPVNTASSGTQSIGNARHASKGTVRPGKAGLVKSQMSAIQARTVR